MPPPESPAAAAERCLSALLASFPDDPKALVVAAFTCGVNAILHPLRSDPAYALRVAEVLDTLCMNFLYTAAGVSGEAKQ